MTTVTKRPPVCFCRTRQRTIAWTYSPSHKLCSRINRNPFEKSQSGHDAELVVSGEVWNASLLSSPLATAARRGVEISPLNREEPPSSSDDQVAMWSPYQRVIRGQATVRKARPFSSSVWCSADSEKNRLEVYVEAWLLDRAIPKSKAAAIHTVFPLIEW